MGALLVLLQDGATLSSAASQGLLGHLVAAATRPMRTAAFMTDSNVETLWASGVSRALEAGGLGVVLRRSALTQSQRDAQNAKTAAAAVCPGCAALVLDGATQCATCSTDLARPKSKPKVSSERE